MSDSLVLQIDGKRIENFLSYKVESDIYTADDAFTLELAQPETAIKAGQQCELWVNEQLELTGLIDRRVRRYDKQGLKLTVEGRDLMGLLVDSHCETFPTVQGKKLSELADMLLRDIPFINRSQIIYQDEAARLKGKLKGKKRTVDNPLAGFMDTPQKLAQIEPGMTVFEVLKIYAASRGLMFWNMTDGTMVFGRPRAKGEPQFTLTTSRQGAANNATTCEEIDDISKRYSRVTVIGQQQGSNDIAATGIGTKATAEDKQFPFRKPYVARDNNDAQSPALRARFLLEQQRHEGYRLTYTVPGHSQNGRNWQINELCRVKDEILGIDDVYLIYGRTLELSRDRGKTTTLKLGPPGLIMEVR